jgi:hypothetical protein
MQRRRATLPPMRWLGLARSSTAMWWPWRQGGHAAIPLGTADFMVHHIHAFTIHVTVLILLKGVLFARSSRLIP